MTSLPFKHLLEPWTRLSIQRRRTLLRWTVLGTIGCIVASLLFVWMLSALSPLDDRANLIVAATVIPAFLGIPLFLFTSYKLRDLAVANHKLEQLAATDALTGCLNRGAFSVMVDNWLTTEAIDAPKGALLIIDADHFKRINDRHGHDEGDVALRLIAQSITKVLRAGDMLGRMGGEEFGVFLPGAQIADAGAIAERVRTAVTELAFRPGDKAHRLSVSIGVAVFGAPVGFTELFRLADRHLYEAKAQGRNRVVVGAMLGVQPPEWYGGSSLH